MLHTFTLQAPLRTFGEGQIVAKVFEAICHLLEVRILQINIHIPHMLLNMAEEGMGCKSIENGHLGIPTVEGDTIL